MAYKFIEFTPQTGSGKMTLNVDYLVTVTDNPGGAVMRFHDHVTAKTMSVLDTYADIKTALSGEGFIEVTDQRSSAKAFVSTQYISSMTDNGTGATLWVNDHVGVQQMTVTETYAALKTLLSVVTP